jgi:transcriptional regulator with XRE-family HTH domain
MKKTIPQVEAIGSLTHNWFMKTIDRLFEETGLTIDEVAARAKMSPERVAAIEAGRWTPGPDERRRLAAAFGVPAESISWGHTMNRRNINYIRKGMKENF